MVSPVSPAPEPGSAASDTAATENALGALNAKTARRQRMVLAGGGGTLALAALWLIFGGGGSDPTSDPDAPQQIETDGLVNRDLSQREFVAIYGNRLDAQARQLKSLEESQSKSGELQTRLDALAAENQALKADGTRTIDALTQENQLLRTQATQAAAAPPPGPPVYGPTAGTAQAGVGTCAEMPAPVPERSVKTLSFVTIEAGVPKGGLKVARVQAPAIEVEDSPDYLPPNSYAPARVIVGVDASAGVASQTDPLPVILRITGPARSVIQDGKLLETNIKGCLVNGAARGDLSAEKVYVKLQKMTCDQPGGRVAVSEVKGFISFAGKTGVRGRVVSREGSLVTQALLAGVVGGFGRGFSANANSLFQGLGAASDGRRRTLSAGEVAEGGFGQGVGEAADTVSKYLIERAEQYQPVIEMPTGIDVEIVFLDGVFVRNTQ
jgi:conjugal transfer pilus assembly protein TraB